MLRRIASRGGLGLTRGGISGAGGGLSSSTALSRCYHPLARPWILGTVATISRLRGFSTRKKASETAKLTPREPNSMNLPKGKLQPREPNSMNLPKGKLHPREPNSMNPPKKAGKKAKTKGASVTKAAGVKKPSAKTRGTKGASQGARAEAKETPKTESPAPESEANFGETEAKPSSSSSTEAKPSSSSSTSNQDSTSQDAGSSGSSESGSSNSGEEGGRPRVSRQQHLDWFYASGTDQHMGFSNPLIPGLILLIICIQVPLSYSQRETLRINAYWESKRDSEGRGRS